MYNTEPMGGQSLEQCAVDAEKTGFVWVDPAPELVVGEVKQMAEDNQVEAVKTGGFWYGPRSPNGAVGQKALKGEKLIYHMHGGAFVMGTGAPSSGPMKTCFDGLLEHCSTHHRIFALEYRLSSAAPFPASNPFPACLLDALAGYRYLVQDVGFDPENILISGDSAGGLLAFTLAYYLATHGSELPDSLRNAGALLLLSPTVDWAVSDGAGPQTSMRRHARSDFVEPILLTGYTRRALLGRLPAETAATSVYISPASRSLRVVPGMFAGLPPTCIVAGGRGADARPDARVEGQSGGGPGGPRAVDRARRCDS
ncbi:hypothetical protein EVJ58_g611 [Rhodofomes roseus]|uniref:Alpha/beta hydrolase fold-3 domain-containing protein n=1 Tax=Rhodofomes roseus TaxID=34475 RepID=A0A4Y9Z5G3_9APHY|nr:hypothetical protein EVJ58_g611 [Rhodofomes roseus]